MDDDYSLRTEQPFGNFVEPATVSKEVPRLRIAHLLLWSLCSAIYLTALQNWKSTADLPEQYDSVRNTTTLIEGIVNGGALTGAIVLLLAWFRNGVPLLKEPGHWLIAGHGLLSLIWLPYSILSMLGVGTDDLMLPIQCCLFFASAVVYFVAIKRCSQHRWKVSFATLLTLTVVKLTANVVLLTKVFDFSVFHWMHLTYSLGDIVLCFWILVVITIDKKKSVNRDWLHWLGVATFIFSQCLYLIWTIGISFF